MAYVSAEMEVGEERSNSRFPLGVAGKALAAVAAVSTAALAWRHVIGSNQAALEDVLQLDQMVVQGPRDTCSPPWTSKSRAENKTENCVNTKCCATTGYNCFQKSPGIAGCLKGCDPKNPGWDCTMPKEVLNLVDVKEVPNTRFYCFTVWTKDRGNPQKHPGAEEELALLKDQFQKGVGVFSCPGTDVFSDTDVSIGQGFDAIKVDDPLNEFHLVKRKKTKTWVNTGMFKQVWKKIGEKGTWSEFDWVIKMDADTVFVPWRLQKMLATQPVSWTGVYIENCAEVQYGFFGSLEVISHEAFATLLKQLDSCSSNIKWASMHATTWGPIGEDLFAQKCMDKHGVSKLQNFDLTTDGVCPSVKKKWGHEKDTKAFKPECDKVSTPVMHPFKTSEAWFACYEKALSTGI